jgi:ubiquinone biosynthesis protein Coq4
MKFDDTSYLLLRLRQTHDLWHVVTGFSTNVPGELGLKAFVYQKRWILNDSIALF